MRPAVIRTENLFPTSALHPDPAQVSETRIPAEVFGAGNAPTRLTATCECIPGTVEAEQFESLVIEVQAPGGKLYTGPLDSLDAVVDEAPRDVKVRVWLADNGRPQAQGVATQWTLSAQPVHGSD